MIKNKVELAEWLNYESKKYDITLEFLKGGWLDYVRLVAGSEKQIIWNFQKRLRKTEYFYNTEKKIRYRISLVLLNQLRNRYGLHIDLNVCDKGLKIMHLGSVLTNPRTKIGKDVSLHINTAFVAQGVSDDAPVIGDNVVIGIGATIVGGVTIAKNVAIGAGAVVVKDIFEENIAVAGVPAKKVSDNGRLKWNSKQTNSIGGQVKDDKIN